MLERDVLPLSAACASDEPMSFIRIFIERVDAKVGDTRRAETPEPFELASSHPFLESIHDCLIRKIVFVIDDDVRRYGNSLAMFLSTAKVKRRCPHPLESRVVNVTHPCTEIL